jgi:hypothetical protein
MKPNEKLSPEEQPQYILLETTDKNYKRACNWETGTILKRVSIWYSGNGCGVRQAYFKPLDDSTREWIAWEDHVKEITDQLELDLGA